MLLHRNQGYKETFSVSGWYPIPSTLSHIVAIVTNVGEKKWGNLPREGGYELCLLQEM